MKITRASRDGGVDAIAFDPDPIRGGKIVIQAKRYSNAVKVSAVRDLYGTVVTAMNVLLKGFWSRQPTMDQMHMILQKKKAITLLSGGNLLHLLAKHGHTARIDLKEAKRILTEKQ